MTALRIVTPPETEPLTLAEARVHCRVPEADTSRDAFLTAYITAARQYAEAYTRRAFLKQTWELTLDEFPFCGMLHWRPTIDVPIVPVMNVVGVSYIAQDGTQTDLAEDADYMIDLASEPARIAPAFGKFWPIARRQLNAVTVTFVAGYGEAADDIPQGLKPWMLLRVGSLYENTQEQLTDKQIALAPLPFVDCLLDPFRAMRV